VFFLVFWELLMTNREFLKSLEIVMKRLCDRIINDQQVMHEELFDRIVSRQDLPWAKAVLAAGEFKQTVKLLQSERLRKQMSLAELETITGISRSTLSELESQKRGNPSIASLEKIAAALGTKLVVALVLREELAIPPEEDERAE
jgi:DNA-binding Xre family transcriptional regulator